MIFSAATKELLAKRVGFRLLESGVSSAILRTGTQYHGVGAHVLESCPAFVLPFRRAGVGHVQRAGHMPRPENRSSCIGASTRASNPGQSRLLSSHEKLHHGSFGVRFLLGSNRPNRDRALGHALRTVRRRAARRRPHSRHSRGRCELQVRAPNHLRPNVIERPTVCVSFRPSRLLGQTCNVSGRRHQTPAKTEGFRHPEASSAVVRCTPWFVEHALNANARDLYAVSG